MFNLRTEHRNAIFYSTSFLQCFIMQEWYSTLKNDGLWMNGWNASLNYVLILTLMSVNSMLDFYNKAEFLSVFTVLCNVGCWAHNKQDIRLWRFILYAIPCSLHSLDGGFPPPQYRCLYQLSAPGLCCHGRCSHPTKPHFKACQCAPIKRPSPR